ncbi:PQQ-binding-like beta-propeller repeat protein [Nocardioides sp.]|uniref:outer membrane protein assembly factor BamB family protein n=1 Tax=Nocardioides sp. TaxID=35761 RepID=UPI001A350024|nr:PQQ-binding-like beta-propeller repeat protein [Nocardioides sp.]MBJ7357656.1 PQQ-binding-like beta-propeller repeat protein [Nocardioides sp.]
MSRLRSTAAWLPALVLVPVGLAASVGASRVDDPAEAMAAMQPLEPGTTWVYTVADHGEPSGRRTRQVLGLSQLVVDGELTDLTRISSVYDAYPGVGQQSLDVYVGIEGQELLQYGVIGRGQTFDIEPPAPAYALPPEVGTSWDYDGTLDGDPFAFEAEVTDVDDIEVGGETFEDCAEILTEVEVQDGEKGEVDEITEWTCPDIGVVRTRTVNEVQDVDVAEELVRFRSPGLALDLGPLPEPVAPDPTATDQPTDQPTDQAPDQGEPSTAGFDARRSHAVPDGVLGRDLAWTDVRDVAAPFPAVSDGRTVVLGEKDGLVSARDEATGELRWQVTLSPPIVAAPAIDEDVVLVADASKALWALSLEDGSAQWVQTFDDVVGAAPTVAGDVVVVPVEDATVVALDPDDGDVEWTAVLGGRVALPPAVQEDVLVVADTAGALTGLDLDDGEDLWSNDLSNGVDLGPAIGGDVVVASDMDGVVNGFDLDDGTLLWQRRGRSYPTQPFAVTDDAVVMVSEGDDVEAFRLDDGARLWARDLEDLTVAPVIVGDEVLAMSEDGRATVLDLEDGAVVDSWRLPRPEGVFVVDGTVARLDDTVVYHAQSTTLGTSHVFFAYPTSADDRPVGVAYSARSYPMPGAPNVPPVLDDSTIYALTWDNAVVRSALPAELAPLTIVDGRTVGLAVAEGVLVVPSGEETIGLDAETGEPLWSLPTGKGTPGSSPAIGDGTAYVPLPEVGLLAADLRTGEARWAEAVPGASGVPTPLPTHDGDVLYAGLGLTRYDGRTGEVVWQLGGELAGGTTYTPLAADRDTVYAPLVVPDPTQPNGERVELVAADLRTGRVRWQQQVGGLKFLVGPAVGSGVVVSTDSANVVTGRDTGTGEVLWSYRMATQPAGTPVVSQGAVHVIERGRPEDLAARNFRVVTLDLATGRFLGAYEPPGANDVLLPTVGAGPDGELLVPTVDLSSVVESLVVTR